MSTNHNTRRTTVEVKGARENNLNGVSIEIPREKLVVVTGVSGSGKSSLAFDTIYAEGQRRLLASMSTYAKRFISRLKKPDVDFVNGLSPVISIDQKSISKNPRSTVGTMTDIQDYLRMLYATLGQAHCPWCEEPVIAMEKHQVLEHLMSLPTETEVEIRSPIWKVWGEDWEWHIEQIRHHGYRNARIDGDLVDLGDNINLREDRDYHIEAVVDRFIINDSIDRAVLAALDDAQKIGDGLYSCEILSEMPHASKRQFDKDFGCEKHGIFSLELHHGNFTFNDPAGACVTCSGLGTGKRVHKGLLIPDPSLTLREGAIVSREYNPNNWNGRYLHSLSVQFDFSLDVPFQELEPKTVNMLFHGAPDKELVVRVPPEAKMGQHYEGREFRFNGFITDIERAYHHYRKQGDANAWMEDYLKKVMVEYDCPDCKGGRLKRARELVTVQGKSLPEVSSMHLEDLLSFLDTIVVSESKAEVGEVLIREIKGRLELLVGIGLDYLSLSRRAGTLSGGEAQRIRLSTQIGSGLMGMLYVLDEPSIGLHSKDNVRMIETIRRLVDIGNSVIVVEHDEDTIRGADFCIELGPGPGVHGGNIVASGSVNDLISHEQSITGAYLSGIKKISVPEERRSTDQGWLTFKGCRHNNLKNVNINIPLHTFTCFTGASGSGKSSFVHETLYKRLYSVLQDSRILPGDHDSMEGYQSINNILHIDQSPIGRSSRSNPATYIGIYDNIRKLFASTERSIERGYTASRFSFNVKGGRCEQCRGEGAITTQLSFMPDVESVCPTCKGARYNSDTLEVTWRDRNIADVLEMSIEEGVHFFEDQRAIYRKLCVMNELGLGYLKVGHPSPLLSGGEAQRLKLAAELGKLKKGAHLFYILDEPTTGLHFADIDRLLRALNRLVDAGHTVVVIEHNMDVIKTADWIIDLGPEGGHAGGEVIACGRPEDVVNESRSHTGRYLKQYLEG